MDYTDLSTEIGDKMDDVNEKIKIIDNKIDTINERLCQLSLYENKLINSFEVMEKRNRILLDKINKVKNILIKINPIYKDLDL